MRRKAGVFYTFQVIKKFHADCRPSPSPDTLSTASTAGFNDGISEECVSAFGNSSGLEECVRSGRDTVSQSGYYKLFQSLRSPKPPSSAAVLIAQHTATCHSSGRGPAPSGAALRPGQCFHLMLPPPSRLLTDGPPAARNQPGRLPAYWKPSMWRIPFLQCVSKTI